jgi:hypothetical protein
MQSPNEFKSLERLRGGIQYIQTLIASVAALFLMVSLMTATWNLLVKDALFRDVPVLEWLWGLSQAVAVDSALAVVFVRMAQAIQNKQRMRSVVYGVVGLLLLFVAVAIIDVESLRQALDITLTAAAGRLPFNISIEFLTQVRSVVVGLLIAISGFELVVQPAIKAIEPTVERRLDTPAPAPAPKPVVVKEKRHTTPTHNGHAKDAASKLAAFSALKPNATLAETIAATGLSQSTISRWRKQHGSEQLVTIASGVGETAN